MVAKTINATLTISSPPTAPAFTRKK